MWFSRLLTVLVVGMVGASEISKFSHCKSVKPKRVPLKKVVRQGPFYTLEISTCAFMGIDITTIDALYFSLDSPCDCGTADIHAIAILKNCSISNADGIMTEMKAGVFYLNGTTFEYEDIIFGKPCKGTYVVYRCNLRESSDNGTISIVSKKRSVDEDCLTKAECLALETFPDLVFTKLPNTVKDPCTCSLQ